MVRLYEPRERIQVYTIERLLTTGNNSIAYAARNVSGEKVFFKLYQSPSIRVKWYRPFIQHQSELKERIERGPCRQFCYRFLGGFEHERKYHQVFEYLDKSYSLAQILEKIQLDPRAIQWEQRELMAKVLVAGINQLHQSGIVHADLKPDNIMLIEDPTISMKYRLKIIDMDFSFFTEKPAPWDGHEGYFGTPGYLSPEHILQKVPGPSSDVFTLGLMANQLLAQGHPYIYDEAEQYLPAYLAYQAAPPQLRGTPRAPAKAECIVNVLHRCLDPDRSRRPSASDLHRALTGEITALTELPREPEPYPLHFPACNGAAVERTGVATPTCDLGQRIVLQSSEGVELSVGARLALGCVVLAKFGTGSRYAANEQFILDRTAEGWFIEPCPATPNDTLVNGELLRDRQRLQGGTQIAIGNALSKKTALVLTVRSG